jgi:Xaa-Pro aminopeptidase
MFEQNVYIQRRKALSNQVGSGLILLMGNEESPMNFKDNTYHFRQDSTFLYYFGIQAANIVGVLDVDSQQEIIFGNEFGIDDIIWMGALERLEEKANKAGVRTTLPLAELAGTIQKALQSGRKVHILPPYRPENKIHLSRLLQCSIDDISSKVSTDLIRAVVAQRSVKEAIEVAEIEKAVNTSVDMHLAAMRYARPGITEREVAALVQQIATQAGGGLAYPAIMTIRGEILHNHDHSNTLKEGQLLLNDSGAETALGYAGDLTRTFPVSKQFTTQQRDAYNVVLQALETATAALRPGIKNLDIHKLSCQTLIEGLQQMGLMKGDAREAVEAGAHTLFFQCGTGHMMGLDVHDMEDLGEQYVGYTDQEPKDTQTFGLKSLRLGKALEEGYILTIEPGLYFIPELLDRWKATNHLEQFINYAEVEKFRHFGGIRIEDNMVITKDSYRVLGKHLAKTVEEIESIRSSAY